MDTQKTQNLIVNTKRGFYSTLGDIAATTVIFFFTVLDEDIRNLVNFQGEYLVQVLRALGVTGPLAGFISNLRSPVDGGGVTPSPSAPLNSPTANRDREGLSPRDREGLSPRDREGLNPRDNETPRPETRDTETPPAPPAPVNVDPPRAMPDAEGDDVLYPGDAYPDSASPVVPARYEQHRQSAMARLAAADRQAHDRQVAGMLKGPVHEGLQLGPRPLRKNSGYVFSQRSLKNRSELSVTMQRVATRGLAYSPFDWVMIEAARTVGEQQEMFDKGLSKTLESRHTETPAEAFDIKILDPITGKGTDNPAMYKAVAEAIRLAAADEEASIVSGALDWGWDIYHFERDRKEFPFRAPDIVLA